MRVLYLTDRLSTRGGADLHLLQVVAWAAGEGHLVTVAHGSAEPGVELPVGVEAVRVKGLGAPTLSPSRLSRLPATLAGAELVHVQNVMNPVALSLAVETGRALVTVQDHRVFCPGPGRTQPDGSRCRAAISPVACAACLPEPDYRARLIALTRARLEALRGASLLVLSRYMAEELEAAGLAGARVVPPWVETGPARTDPGHGFVVGGRLVAHKGVLDALAAWRLARTDQPLLVAGAGPLEPRLDGARRLGWLAVGELRALLRRARALLFPAQWQEPFGILGLEALAEGTPVVVAASGGTADWSAAGCLVVPPNDPAAMAEAASRLAADPTFALALGESGRAAVARRFGREAVEGRLREVYAAVAGRGVQAATRPGRP